MIHFTWPRKNGYNPPSTGKRPSVSLDHYKIVKQNLEENIMTPQEELILLQGQHKILTAQITALQNQLIPKYKTIKVNFQVHEELTQTLLLPLDYTDDQIENYIENMLKCGQWKISTVNNWDWEEV